ncbi:glycosyltransferase family 4 protein [Methanonatronarchaeum thermophilum]|nr:glycosyltransferase family 4 protein [Methanonatronarchaeum thermophilum]
MAYHALNLSKALSEIGNEVHVLTIENAKNLNFCDEIYNKLNLHYIPVSDLLSIKDTDFLKKLYFMIKLKKKVNNLIENEGFDVIHSHGNSAALIEPKAPLITKCHNIWINQLSLPINKSLLYKNYIKGEIFFEKKILSKSSKIITVSRMLSNSIYSEYGYDSNVLHNAVPTIPTNINSNDLSKKDEVLMVGTFTKRKGCHLIPEIVNEISKRNLKLIHIGEVRNKTLFDKVIKQLKRKNNIDFFSHKPHIEKQKDLYIHYSNAKLLIHPAIYEPFGNVPIEAISCKTPALVSDKCGCSELEEEFELLKTSNLDNFVKSILDVIDIFENKDLEEYNQYNKDYTDLARETEMIFKELI